jgi:glycosyltransferase involved in cell wall biosynthesis
MKILISAYALSPYKGSEFSVGWNTITQLARFHTIWVLYGASDNHMGDTGSLKNYLKNHSVAGVTFIKVEPTTLAKRINSLNKFGLSWFFYFAFYLWQKRAYLKAKELVDSVDIDVVHQLNPIGFREPGFLWKLNKPFVWGPIGGTHFVKLRLFKKNSYKAKLKFLIKNKLTEFQLKFSRRVSLAMHRADAVIASTGIDKEQIFEFFNKESYHFPENGIVKEPYLNATKFPIKGQLQLVWSGSIEHRKNLEMCLIAVSKIKSKNWKLNILGIGPLITKMQNLAEALAIGENIIWHGHLERREAIQIMADSHLHLITSVNEANSTVLFEAMTYGVPTLTLDHCGMADVVCDKCGIKIEIDSYREIINSIVFHLNQVLENPSILADLSKGTVECAKNYTWNKRLTKLNEIYCKAIENWNFKQGKKVSNIQSSASVQ